MGQQAPGLTEDSGGGVHLSPVDTKSVPPGAVGSCGAKPVLGAEALAPKFSVKRLPGLEEEIDGAVLRMRTYRRVDGTRLIWQRTDTFGDSGCLLLSEEGKFKRVGGEDKPEWGTVRVANRKEVMGIFGYRPTPPNHAQRWKYDAQGREVEREVDWGIDGVWDLKVTKSYDTTGKLAKTLCKGELGDGFEAGCRAQEQRWKYDGLGQLVEQYRAEGEHISHTKWVYDGKRLKSHRRTEARKFARGSEKTYDARGQLLKAVESMPQRDQDVHLHAAQPRSSTARLARSSWPQLARPMWRPDHRCSSPSAGSCPSGGHGWARRPGRGQASTIRSSRYRAAPMGAWSRGTQVTNSGSAPAELGASNGDSSPYLTVIATSPPQACARWASLATVGWSRWQALGMCTCSSGVGATRRAGRIDALALAGQGRVHPLAGGGALVVDDMSAHALDAFGRPESSFDFHAVASDGSLFLIDNALVGVSELDGSRGRELPAPSGSCAVSNDDGVWVVATRQGDVHWFESDPR